MPTRTVAAFVAEAGAPPEWVMEEAKRTLVNVLAISISASVHPSSARLLVWARAEGGAPTTSVIGSDLKTSPSLAALVNGFLAHLQDYDDTHYPTVLHPSAPVWPAALAAAEETRASGRDALVAFALGCEVACRIAMSVHPWHYDAGWHITGTVGVLGAAAAAGRLHGLDAEQLSHALGFAGTQAGGVREVFGSDGKALHAGRAASNGVQSAEFARAGMTANPEILAGRRGFWAVLSPDGHNEEELVGGLGERWELRRNGLKPYANGVVSHPIQDGVIALRNEHGLTAEQVERIDLRVSRLVPELMNRAAPSTGLEAKFSFQHCAAAALVDGAGHDAQFDLDRVLDPGIAALRAKVTHEVDPALPEHEAYISIALTDGRTVSTHVEHASGSPENPLTNDQLSEKFHALVEPVLGAARARQVFEAAWSLDEAGGVTDLLRLTRP
ncbi:MAG: MmgE/PrpD family protein [Dehalococcoidia bacterium]|nr:MmgE/PrpD family protein [Dehalococcoidia bacterium]